MPHGGLLRLGSVLGPFWMILDGVCHGNVECDLVALCGGRQRSAARGLLADVALHRWRLVDGGALVQGVALNWAIYRGCSMLIDLRYALAQLRPIIGDNSIDRQNALDRVVLAIDALERCIEAAERPADAELDAIFADEDAGFTDAERALLAKIID